MLLHIYGRQPSCLHWFFKPALCPMWSILILSAYAEDRGYMPLSEHPMPIWVHFLPLFEPSVVPVSKLSLPFLLPPQLVAVLEFYLPHWLKYRIDFCTGRKEFNWWITVAFIPLHSANLQAISVFQKIGPSGRSSIWIWASAIYLPQALRAQWSSVVT